MEPKAIIGIVCITLAFILEFGSYFKQISKTLRTQRSAQVSSSAFLCKIVKYIVTLIGLAIFANWVAFVLECGALGICTWALYIIAKHKPKRWRLFPRFDWSWLNGRKK